MKIGYISHICSEAFSHPHSPWADLHQILYWVEIADVITCDKIVADWLKGSSLWWVKNWGSHRQSLSLLTLCYS